MRSGQPCSSGRGAVPCRGSKELYGKGSGGGSRRSDEREGVRNGGEGGIRTPVPVTRQDAFEAPPLRPLRYLSVGPAENYNPSSSGAATWPSGREILRFSRKN